jgi:Zn-dependent protease with chaperone function
MIHQSQRENTQKFITKLTNLLFVLVMIYPILESLSGMAVSEIEHSAGFILIKEFRLIYLPYLLALWLYFYSTAQNLSKKTHTLLNAETEKGKLIYQWLRDAGVNNVAVLVSTQKEIAAQAFGTKSHKYISVTQNALDHLAKDELRALITHEAAHHYFGDSWKMTLARSLTVTLLLSRLAVELTDFVSTARANESGNSTILFFLPALLSLFAYAIMSIGILAISRLRELIADNFTLSILGDDSAYIRLMVRIAYTSSPSLPKAPKLPVPKVFDFHPGGTKRLYAMNNPETFLDDIRFALAFVGLLLGTMIGIQGLIGISILFSLPLVILLGSPVLYYVVDRLDHYGKKVSIAFAYTGSVSLTVMLLTLVWSIVQISSPLAVSQMNPTSLTEEYYATPLVTLGSDFYLLFDNYLVTFLAGGSLLVAFLFVAEIIKKLAGRISVGPIKLKSILVLVIWIVLSFTVALLWLNAFGPSPVMQYLS